MIHEFAPMKVNHILAKNNNFSDALSRTPAFNEHYVQLSTIESDFFDRIYLVSKATITSPEEFKPLQTTEQLHEKLAEAVRASQLRDDYLLKIIQVLEGILIPKDMDITRLCLAFELIDERWFK
jgi:hypothetical protein